MLEDPNLLVRVVLEELSQVRCGAGCCRRRRRRSKKIGGARQEPLGPSGRGSGVGLDGFSAKPEVSGGSGNLGGVPTAVEHAQLEDESSLLVKITSQFGVLKSDDEQKGKENLELIESEAQDRTNWEF